MRGDAFYEMCPRSLCKGARAGGNLVAQMTLEEKAALCGGKDFWTTHSAARLGLEPVVVTDGPHGLRKQAAAADPLVSGKTAAGLICGIQSQNVGTCLKHYLANNQEKARLVSNLVIDEWALRETYLAGFETAVKEAQPWTMMCSYNQIKGVYASDNKRLMTDVPRGEWGFKGAIMTDWGAINDRVQGVRAGLDLEMPGPRQTSEEAILAAIADGTLTEAELDACARRQLAMMDPVRFGDSALDALLAQLNAQP